MSHTPNPDPVPVPDAGGEPPAAAGQATPGQPIIIQTQGSGGSVLLRLFALFGWLGFGLCAVFVLTQLVAFNDYYDTTGGITEKYHSGAEFGSDKIAIIDVSGVIVDGDGYVKHQIDRIEDDPSVKAVVLRIDSPGGTVAGSDYIFHHLTRLRDEKGIPVVVSMGSFATSGAYYVAMAVGDQEKAIYAEPTTTTGSIGVIIPRYDISGLLKRFDVKDDSIASHPRKQMLAMTKPMPEEHRQLVEAYLDESFTRFKEVVQQGRPEFRDNKAALDALATGEIFSAARAQENGLIDEIGFIEEAINRAMQLADLDKTEARVIRYEQPPSLFGSPLMSTASMRNDLLELTTPQAYYLVSSLPPWMASYKTLLQDR